MTTLASSCKQLSGLTGSVRRVSSVAGVVSGSVFSDESAGTAQEYIFIQIISGKQYYNTP